MPGDHAVSRSFRLARRPAPPRPMLTKPGAP